MTTAKITSTITLRPPGEASLNTGRAKIPEDDLTTIPTITLPFGTNASCGAFNGLEPRHRQYPKNPLAVDVAGGTTPHP
jgi:hypothetical protein